MTLFAYIQLQGQIYKIASRVAVSVIAHFQYVHGFEPLTLILYLHAFCIDVFCTGKEIVFSAKNVFLPYLFSWTTCIKYSSNIVHSVGLSPGNHSFLLAMLDLVYLSLK